jgi:uncharacterized membrane protein
MATHEHSIEVHRPIRTVYDQWTQFESFPKFMSGVESVTQVDETHTHWKAKIAGVSREFDAEITEQEPEQRVAWRSTGGPTHAGVVTVHKIDDDTTRVMLQMDVDAEGLVEKAGDAVGVLDRQLKSDLEHFKEFIESQPAETGAYRGSVPRD